MTIHDLGETGTEGNRVPFLVMELVRGEGMDAMLRRGVVTLADAARWGAQIGDALADAHAAGIMHRDIKPSNILITPSRTVKVLDFGIARAADPYATADRLTQTGFIVGTPPYMAPEQARGFPEPRGDLYALGCLLFELITGRLPFQAPDSVGYLTAHQTQLPPTPSSVTAGIPPAWDDVVLTLLNKDPAQRYPNAANLAHALRQLDHEPQPAPLPVTLTQHPTTPRTTPLPPGVSAPGPSSGSPQPKPASLNNPAHLRHPAMGRNRAALERFGPSAVLAVLLTVTVTKAIDVPLFVIEYGGEGIRAYVYALAITLAVTAALTPRSRVLTRGIGYVTALLAVIGVNLIATDNRPLCYVTTVLTIAAYSYRDVKTRRARSLHGTSTHTTSDIRAGDFGH
ncbi:hypothetical protein Shyhy01_17860 [Streptomyces hygroscopicus subsp. hygroscopicus]|nr:serine/threonine-protein kinase [Streptomyces hygroscopicus]GLX48836.1 hypothetical protein Shyhy01_17860 [Streptomyces hygroscopicus subsp. hygroscopicus]